MTRTDAENVLGVQASASKDDIRRAYNERYTDLQIRLTNAPTPQLRKAYQKNIQELREACDLLAPGFIVDATSDLPASQPSLGSAPVHARAVPSRPAPTQAPPRPSAESVGLPRSTMIAAVFAVLLAGAAAFLAIRWQQSAADAVRNAADAEKLKVAAEALQKRAVLVENAPFRVCNRSSERVSITWLGVGYREGDQLKSFNSALCDVGPWTVSPGGSLDITVDRSGCQWDGSVIFFALTVKTADGGEYPVAGSWSEVKKGCAKVAE